MLGNKKTRWQNHRAFLLVEVTGLEPAASCSQSRRATNCATPRYCVFDYKKQARFLLRFPKFHAAKAFEILTAAPQNPC